MTTITLEIPLTGLIISVSPLQGSRENPIRPAVRFLEEIARGLQQREPENPRLWGIERLDKPTVEAILRDQKEKSLTICEEITTGGGLAT